MKQNLEAESRSRSKSLSVQLQSIEDESPFNHRQFLSLSDNRKRTMDLTDGQRVDSGLSILADESPRGASVLLSSLWQDLRTEEGPEGAHGPAHRGETLHLWALWQSVWTPPLATRPPPAPLQQDDLHAASEGRDRLHSAHLQGHFKPSLLYLELWDSSDRFL